MESIPPDTATSTRWPSRSRRRPTMDASTLWESSHGTTREVIPPRAGRVEHGRVLWHRVDVGEPDVALEPDGSLAFVVVRDGSVESGDGVALAVIHVPRGECDGVRVW